MAEVVGDLHTPKHKNDRGTKTILGKPHYWMQDDNGTMHLFRGIAPNEVREKVVGAAAGVANGHMSLSDALDSLGVKRS